MKKKLQLSHLLFLTSIIILFISITNLLSWSIDKNKTEQLSEKLKEVSEMNKNETSKQILMNPPDDMNDIYWKYVELDFLQIDFTDLLKKNNDTVGWIQVNGTKVDYPIVQSTNNKYYLTHSFDHSINSAGWIYSDFRNNLYNLNSNTVIYGHGRYDNTMFGSLKNVLNENWYNKYQNHIIKIATENENSIWQIFSVYTILKETYYITTHFINNDSYQKFIDTIIKRSIYSFSTYVNTDDKILTLSTCKDDFGNRIVIHAKLIKKEILS